MFDHRRKHLYRNSLTMVLTLLVCVLPCFSAGAFAEEMKDLHYTAEFPYAISSVTPFVSAGGNFQGRICMFYTGSTPKQTQITMQLPTGIVPVDLPSEWRYEKQAAGALLTFSHSFVSGYENYFELLQFQTAKTLPVGDHEIPLTITADDQILGETLKVAVGEEVSASPAGPAIAEILLPYDREAGQDRRLDNGTLLLRDSVLDYYKSLLSGKGAVSTAAETVHPLTHMGLQWVNPSQQAKLILVQARLLNKETLEPVSGLVSPESSINEEGTDGGMNQMSSTHLTAFAALDGSVRQMMDIPVYADETMLKNGDYLLEVSAEENGRILTRKQIEIKVVARDTQAGLTTGLAMLATLLGLPYILARGRLQRVKCRHLITTGLFGTTAFAAVNVPGTFLNDFFSIVLGPFSFILSGMFSGLLLYMLIGSLVFLIPRFGIATLMLMVRMLINMLVFGHISPLSVLIYGVQAILLEAAFWCFGITRGKVSAASLQTAALMGLACGGADAVSTYVNLQAFSFLYRLFYADWYIALCMLVSGFIYPVIGAACGVLLGKELKKVGVD